MGHLSLLGNLGNWDGMHHFGLMGGAVGWVYKGVNLGMFTPTQLMHSHIHKYSSDKISVLPFIPSVFLSAERLSVIPIRNGQSHIKL